MKQSINLGCWLSIILLYAVAAPVSAGNSHDWRFNAHSRNIDIDICIRCTSTIPGPPGPQGPPGDTHQTIITLHDDANGHAAGWNPPSQTPVGVNLFTIQAPIDLNEEISFEATVIHPENPTIPGERGVAQCRVDILYPLVDSFRIQCPGAQEGSILTYIITRNE
jgi:hypothetical protein